MQKIVPHLWFDNEAKEAAAFYVEAFGSGSEITHASVLRDTPSGDCDVLSFRLRGYEFMAISAGPHFTLNPSISFILNFDPSQDADARKQLDALWKILSNGGKALMPIDAYPFSERYGWIQDRYGVSWQLLLSKPEGDVRPFITPSLMFTNNMYGKADEAIDFYVSIFGHSGRSQTARYPKGMDPDEEGRIMYADFQLEGQWFAAMESAREHEFAFNEAISLMVRCKDQKEIDAYWSKLSAVPESEQCGWLKDRYGVSWQIIPVAMNEMMRSGTPEQIDRLTKAFLRMKKFDVEALKKAFEG